MATEFATGGHQLIVGTSRGLSVENMMCLGSILSFVAMVMNTHVYVITVLLKIRLQRKKKKLTLFILTSCGVVCRRLRGMNVFNFGMNEAYVLVPNS